MLDKTLITPYLEKMRARLLPEYDRKLQAVKKN